MLYYQLEYEKASGIWSMDKKMNTNMVIKALDMAYENRQEAKSKLFEYILPS